MKSCVTISLVEEARGGPFVYWNGIEDGCERAAALGYDAVEIFAPSADAVRADDVKPILDQHNLRLAAVGTGAGWVKHGLSLTDPGIARREQARDFVKSIIECAGEFGASAIIGSMQGRYGGNVHKTTALGYLGESLAELGEFATQFHAPLIYEPLNRYETNLCNTMAEGVSLITQFGAKNVVLLADLFHMNIEERDIAESLKDAAKHIGHIHFVDSNRRAVGAGHTDFFSIALALREMNYAGYLSAEVFALPDSNTAAEWTIKAFREITGGIAE